MKRTKMHDKKPTRPKLKSQREVAEARPDASELFAGELEEALIKKLGATAKAETQPKPNFEAEEDHDDEAPEVDCPHEVGPELEPAEESGYVDPSAVYGLTEQQLTAAWYLGTGMARGDVAKHVGVDPSTLWRWRQLPTFKARVNSSLECVKEASIYRLAILFDKAVGTLRKAMDDGTSDSLKAAQYVIEHVLRLESGPIDPRVLIREELALQAENGDPENVTKEAYEERCRELGVEP